MFSVAALYPKCLRAELCGTMRPNKTSCRLGEKEFTAMFWKMVCSDCN